MHPHWFRIPFRLQLTPAIPEVADTLFLYLPLMAPALALVAIFAILLVRNDYLNEAVLLSVRNMTFSISQGNLFADVDAPYNAMMAAAIIFVLPPIALPLCFRRYVSSALAMNAGA